MEDDRKRDPQELAKELKRIYSDDEGKLPDFTRLDGKPGSRLKSAVLGVLVTLATLSAVTWAGFFFFTRTSGFTGEGVELRVESAGELTSGADAELTVRWKNGERVPLARAVVRLKTPDGFTVVSTDPSLPESGEWTVGSIAPGAEGSIKLVGWARGEPGATLTFQAELDYKPADFNSDFQKVSSHTVAIKDSVFTLTADGPDQMTPGDDIAMVFSYENASDRAFEGMRFSVDPLEGFIPAGAEPAMDKDVSYRWTLPKIEARQKGSFTVKGTFAATSRGPKAMTGRLGFVIDDAFIPAVSAEAKTEVLKSDLALGMIVNGGATSPTVSFDDTLFFTVTYENAGDVTLRDVTVSAELPTTPAGVQVLDWVSLKDELGGKRVGSTITWTKKEIEGLAQLAPGDKGQIDFSVQLSRKPDSAVEGTAYAVEARASAVIGRAGKVSGSREIETTPIAIRLRSDAAFKAYGRWFTDDGTPLGSGPLPPKVGEKTVYRIHWTVQNTLHELTNLSVTTLLPQGVKWTGVERPVEAGELTFDESGRQVTWRLNRMPTSVKSVTATFDVEFTPVFEDVGKIVDLTGENRFEAYDKEVETIILKTEPPIGTDLLGDENAAGKGVVRE